MSKFRLYGTRTSEVSELEKNNRNLARRAATEGMVLLKNNGALPLKEEKVVDLFGTGARMTVFGGSGSGETKGREKITVEKGLINAGVKIGNTAWLDRFDAKYQSEYKKWHDEVEEAIKGYNIFSVIKMYEEIYRHHFNFPVGDAIEKSDMTPGVDTVIYVLARQAGEGGDRRAETGDYYLTDIEKDSIRFLKANYKRLIVIINAGAALDMDILDEVDIDGLIFMGQPGEEAGNALADILTGRAVPSGHLTSTWAIDFKDYPSADIYGKNSKNDLESDYKEGIYVGYRWFDANKIKARFPFGYGLSYASFDTKFLKITQDKDNIELVFGVTNKSQVFEGAHVVQVYVSKLNTEIYQVKKEFCGFEKTKILKPGESQEIVIKVPIKGLKSFIETNNRFELLAGQYVFLVGDNAENCNQVAVAYVKKSEVVQKLKNLTGTSRFKDARFGIDETEVNNLEKVVIETSVLREEIGSDYFEDDAKQKAKKFSEKLTEKEIASLIVGANVTGFGYNHAPGAVGKTTNSLLKKYNVPNINMADGPAGLNLLPENYVTKGGQELAYGHLPQDRTWGFLKKMEWMAVGKEGRDTPVFQYTTAFPSTTVRAQSFNKELEYEIGLAVGREMEVMGITLWLAPAINIQRNPLCGRNFEYASEDPFLSGKMAASIINGVQSVGGVGVTLKHFCANNQETEREFVSSNISVRALREIYLKGFEIAITESHPWAVMSSYNRLNGTYTGNHKELLTNVLRGDFGFDGIVMTDWRAITKKKGAYHLCASSGNDLIMPGEKAEEKIVLEDIMKGRLLTEDARKSAERILTIVYSSNVWKTVE